MAGWRSIETNLHITEYAKRVCKEIGWPYSGNLALIADCISSLAYMKGLDVWGGFISLMEAVELAKQQAIRVDRWFFQDGKYNEIENEFTPKISAQSEQSSPAVLPELRRKPN